MNSAGPDRRILIVSGDILPFPGLPTTGAGLRAWGLGKGLESRGHEVRYLMPETSLKRISANTDTTPYRPFVYNHLDPQELNRRLTELSPDVVVFQHWTAAVNLSDHNRIPAVIDFHGPLLLETLYQDLPHYDNLRQLKLRTLPKADFFTCAGEQQRHYFYPWLMLSGFDVRQDVIQVIPVSISPDIPARAPAKGEPTFVYGGVFLPWQDPSVSLETLVQTLEDRGIGRLQLFGGLHPHVTIPPGKYHDLIPRLEASPSVDRMGMISHDALVETYLRSHVAIDVMARNPERELAFTTRTVEYLWCGLPVIYNDYAELADHIRDYDAGWTVDPLDAAAIRTVIESILDDPASVTRKSCNAQTLVRERFSWDRTIGPLDAFCRRPRKHTAGQLVPLSRLSEQHDALEDFARRARVDVRRARRTWLARSIGIAREVVKRLLRRSYVMEMYGRQVKVNGPLLAGQKAGQSFRAYGANLSGLELLVGTWGRLNSCDLVLHLQYAPGDAEDLAVASSYAALIRDCTFCRFTFQPIANSANHDFYFWVESPDAVLGDCVTLFLDLDTDQLVFSQVYS